MRIRTLPIALGTALAMLLAGCLSHPTDDEGGPTAEGDKDAPFLGGKADAWDSRNDPERFASFLDKDLAYELAGLPKSGEADNKPWPGSYWPTYMDSANHRWEGKGTWSPLEKYDLVFNGWVPEEGFSDLRPFDPNGCGTDNWDKDYYSGLGPAAKFQSEYKGNKNSRDGQDSDDDGMTDECDTESNDGVEFWWGLCHAWTPAAMNEPEPRYPVTLNGVTFQTADIKALLMVVYDSSKSVIIGGRCNTKDVERDENGRIKDDKCRDTNAGTFHVSLANFLGRYNMSIAEDRTYDYEVWNQPIHSFDVEELDEVDETRAVQLRLGEDTAEGTRYPHNPDAKRWAEVKTKVRYVTESHAESRPLVPELESYLRTDRYHYLLEMDGDGNIIGGEWLNAKVTRESGFSNQPDFLWASTGPAGWGWNTNSHVDYQTVKSLLDKSQSPPQEGGGGGGEEVERLEELAEPGRDIPDNLAGGVRDSLTISAGGEAKRVFVKLDVTHTYVGDLVVTLFKDGTKVAVLRDGEGGGDNDIHDQVEVPALAGRPVAGTYELLVVDRAKRDEGTLDRWGIVAEL